MKANAIRRLGRTAPRLVSPLLLWAALAASAHKPSDAYLRLEVRGNAIEQRTDIALRDLDRELVLDTDDDGQLSWGEVRSRWPQIDQLAQAGIALRADGQACEPGAAGPAQLDSHSDGRYAVLTRRWQCAAAVRHVSVGYNLFAASDPTHRGIVSLSMDGAVRTAVLVPGAAPLAFAEKGAPAADAGADASVDTGASAAGPGSFFGFVMEGIHHILIGTDHVLFLLALLLPAVLMHRGGGAPGGVARGAGSGSLAALRQRHSAARTTAATDPAEPAMPWHGGAASASAGSLAWRSAVAAEAAFAPATAFVPVLVNVAKVVTAFTVAHSITLALAVLGIVNAPSRVVESVIAATVALAAIDNLRPFLPRERWKLTFVFGLVHGFGFASALQDLGLMREALASSLIGFNLGVEIGQLGIVALFLPLAWWSRGSWFYRRVVLGGGSLVIAAMAVLWLIERAGNISIFG